MYQENKKIEKYVNLYLIFNANKFPVNSYAYISQ